MYENESNINFDMKPEAPAPKKGMSYGKKVMVAISLGLFFGVCGGLGFQAVTSASDLIKSGIEQAEAKLNISDSEDAGNDAKEEAKKDAIEALGEAESSASSNVKTVGDNTQPVTAVVTDVTHVVDAVMPAVVSVSNNYVETMNFYGQKLSSEATASGSGIIVGENDTELLIVSNYHVVYETEKLEITFIDGSTAEAQVKGTEPSMDLAVVAVKLEDISSKTLNSIAIATLGNSDTLTVGEPAIAIGNALGYGQSVTTGVISALDREGSYYNGESQVTSTFIQTDAAINPGNSGGALLNMKGEVIGINSNKAGGTMIEGMGYAIPISAAEPIIADLMQMQTRGKVAQEEQGYLGITGLTVGDEYAQAYNLPKGVYISQVFDGTAAEAAGLVKGDIITRFDGTEVLSMEALQKRLGYYNAGEVIEITIMRGDAQVGYDEKSIQIELGSRTAIQQ